MRAIVSQYGGDFIYSKAMTYSAFREPGDGAGGRLSNQPPTDERGVARSYRIAFRAGHSRYAARYSVTLSMLPQGCPPRPPREALISQSFFEALSAGSRKGLRLLGQNGLQGKAGTLRCLYLVEQRWGPQYSESPPVAPPPIDAQSRRGKFIWSSAIEISCDRVEQRIVTIGRSAECNIIVDRPGVEAPRDLHHFEWQGPACRTKLFGHICVDGPGPEVFVRREDILLFGSGVISPGLKSSLGDAQVLHYEIVSD